MKFIFKFGVHFLFQIENKQTKQTKCIIKIGNHVSLLFCGKSHYYQYYHYNQYNYHSYINQNTFLHFDFDYYQFTIVASIIAISQL